MSNLYFPLNEVAATDNWPIAGLLPGGLDKVWVGMPYYDEPTQTGRIPVLLENEIDFKVPGLDFLSLMVGSVSGAVNFELHSSIAALEIGVTLPLTLRVDAEILRPVKAGTSEPDMDATTLDIALPSVDFGINGDGDIRLDISGAVTVPRCIVGTSGVVLQIGKLQWVTPATPESRRPPRTPAGFTGLYFDDVIVEIPQLPAAVGAIRMDDVFLGTGGFSGKISQPNLALQWNGTDFTGAIAGELFGFKGGISAISIEFRQNALVGCAIKGDVFVPYVDKRVGLTLALDGNGGVTATADLPTSLPAETGVSAGSPGYLINVQLANVLKFDIASLTFEALPGNLPRLGIHGRVSGDGALDFPPMELSGLWIDTRGQIQTEGDGIGLPQSYIVNFKGAQLEISKLAFGNTEDGGKWIGFSGGVKLVQGMPAGASVEGLRITWYDDGSRQPDVSLNGVRINFEVPNTLKFTGEISYNKDLDEFRGAVKLDLIALNMQVDATAVFGLKDGQVPYLGLYLAAEFPAGIPLFATGLGVYGAAGLFAMNMEPNRAPGKAWYSLPADGDWYHAEPEVGVTHLNKWKAIPGSMAFGAGVTLGTIADNGHTFSGKMLLAIVFPGPILLLEGSANILRERATLAEDANFRALAVLDGRAGTLQLGLDAKYRYDSDGNLIDINGSADAFFNFNDPNAWHLNVGLKEPRDRRLTARLFKLFDSYSYVMLNSQELAMGAWIGFENNWTFGPLNVGLEAWIDANARVSWKPAHFYGDLALHGSAKLSVFGFSAGLTVDAMIAADVFDPLHIKGDFSVAIDLPWPLSDIEVGVTLEWGPQPTRPPFPLPLKEVAIEHFKATTSWPLPREVRGETPRLLFPNYDPNGDGFFEPLPEDDSPIKALVPDDLDDLPIVPLDSRPHLTFARNINDDALVGVNAMPMNPDSERIGDPVAGTGPATIRYGLKEVALEKLNSAGAWQMVAYKGPDPDNSKLPALFGSWAPMPLMPGGGGRNVGQVKLWLWSKTPFEYTRRMGSRTWDEWFTDEHSDYPCQTVISDGWDFENIAVNPNVPDPFRHPDEQGLAFTQQIINVIRNSGFSIQELEHPSHGFHHAFGISGKAIDGTTLMALPRKSSFVRIKITDGRLVNPNHFTGFDDAGNSSKGKPGGPPDSPYIDITGKDLTQIFYNVDNYVRFPLARNLRGVRGSAYDSERRRIILCEFNTGTLASIDVNTGEYKVLGTGYSGPMDVVLTADRTTAYITEDIGTLLRVDLTTTGRVDRSNATEITKGMDGPRQIALNEAKSKAYVVEARGEARLLSIELAGPKAGEQTTIVKGLINAFGLLLANDGIMVYVCEVSAGALGARLTRINIDTLESKVLFENMILTFFLRWENEAQNSILAMQLDPDGNWLARLDITGRSTKPEVLERNFFTGHLWGVLVLPNDRYVVCSETQLTMFSTTLLIPEIIDVGGSVFSKHFEESFAHWKQAGEVLEPHTKYRLQVSTTMRMRGDAAGPFVGLDETKTTTEYAYFRTAGPPGVAQLTAPAGSEALAPPFVSALDDLSRYVRKTMPPTVEPTPVNPVSSQVAYRAYDIGFEFDENYVDLMYRIGRRDLSIHVHDSNGAIRNDEGRRLILTNQWGQAETVTLKDHEERWLSVLGSGGCDLIPIGSIVKDTTFNATTVAHVLPPSSLCEARLVPALLHDDFGSYGPIGVDGPNGKFGRWQVADLSGSENSHWQVNPSTTDSELVQTKTNVTSTLVYTNAPASELADDDQDQPLNWTDYRLTVQLEFDDGRAGMVWRYRDAGQHYRFVMEIGKCELFRVAGGATDLLATSTGFIPPIESFAITVEAVGATFNVHQGSTLLLSATDSTIDSGSVGFFTSGTASVKFTDIYVDDFRATAAVVYRFSFLSSRFKNFKDQIESFEDKTMVAAIDDSANAAPFVNAAGAVDEAPLEAELRAFDGLLALVPGVAATPVVRVTRVEQDENAIAFLVQSPEPLDWKRIDLKVLRSPSNGSTELLISVLRKADGAGLMIVSPGPTPSGSFFPEDDYRLVFTYRRDNRAKDRDSDVLSEAGDTSPEQVTIILPWQTQQEESVEELAELLVPA